MRPPDMIRVEISVGDELLRLAVRNGAEWWRWDAEQGVSRGSALPNRRGIATLPSLLGAPMIDVRQLITSVRFEPTGVGELMRRAEFEDGECPGSGARSRFSTTLRSLPAASRSKSPAIAETA
jgi:hypothetical protein